MAAAANKSTDKSSSYWYTPKSGYHKVSDKTKAAAKRKKLTHPGHDFIRLLEGI